MEIKAKAKYIPISPEKVRSVSNHLRGKKVEQVLAYLEFEPRAAKLSLMKLVNSAVSSAETKKLDKDRLIVKEIRVDAGPIYKKQRIRARGRADLQKRRTSHITIVLSDVGNLTTPMIGNNSSRWHSKSKILNPKQILNNKIQKKKKIVV